VDGVRHRGVPNRSHDAKASVVTLEDAEVEERLGHFFDEERDALGLVEQRPRHVGREPLDAEHLAGHREGFGFRQRTERDPRLKAARAEGRGVAKAMRRDDQDARRAYAVAERGEVLLGARVDPVEVLEHEHQRASHRATQGHREHRVEDALSAPRGVHRDDGGISGIDGEEIPYERNVRLERTQAAHPVLDLRDDLGLAVELVDTEVLAKLIHDGQERTRLAERDAAALEPRRRLARRREPAPKFEQKP